MEIAVKICTLIVYLLYMLEIIEANKLCKVPNGEAGKCVPISKCPPLMNLMTKKYKTRHDNMYFQQSFCGRPGVAIMKVCCPSEVLWNRFDVKPVLYPHSARVTELKTLNLAPTPAPEPKPITNNPVTSGPDSFVPLSIPDSREEFDNRNLDYESCGKDTSSANKIIGGTVVQIDQYPWLALLQYSGEVLACGGSLISHKFVLTAAHCLNGVNGVPTHVRLSEYNTTSNPTDYVETDGGGIDVITVKIIEVKDIYPHPRFNRFRKTNDIGLVEMMKSVRFNDFIKKICLPDRDFMPQFGPSTNFTIAGWGGTAVAKESEVKLEVSIPYVPFDRCEKVQSEDVMDSQICAGGMEGKDSCEGDSGGPLMYVYDEKYYAVGLISYGYRTCGTEGMPATHTNVYKYITWIKKIMSENAN